MNIHCLWCWQPYITMCISTQNTEYVLLKIDLGNEETSTSMQSDASVSNLRHYLQLSHGPAFVLCESLSQFTGSICAFFVLSLVFCVR